MLLAVWFAFLAFVVPNGASAQIPVTDVINQANKARVEVQTALKDSFGFQAQLALVNALQFIGERFAYETAVWVASGGKAQSPLFDQRSRDDFIRDTAFGAGTLLLNDMDKFAGGQFGFEDGFGVAQLLCAPSAPKAKLSIKLGLEQRLKPRQPLCTWKKASENWEQFYNMGPEGWFSGIGAAFEPGESDFSVALDLHVGLGEKQAQKALLDLQEKLANKGYKPLQEKISGLTKTPASVVEDTMTKDLIDARKEGFEMSTDMLADAVSATDTLVPMLTAAGQALAVNFAVTLVSQTLQKQVMEKGLFLGDLFKEDAAGQGSGSSGPSAGRARQAQALFAEFKRPRFVSSGSYDQLTEFASCDPSRRQTTTCVIDDGFAKAVRRADAGESMTVGEALTAGLLHADWPLIAEGTAKDQNPNCVRGLPDGGYCASNLKKARRARIIPIGWELAANHEANIATQPITLGEVVAAFHADGRDGRCGTNDTGESPFCGLIDPNWVLRYPIQQCRLRAPGESLLESNTNVRAEGCVDAPSCLEMDAEGKCVGGFGYCLAERNVWFISGQSCPSQAASCRALTSRTGQSLNALTATVDRSVCTAENAGCRWYAASQDAAKQWDASDRRYFNRLAEQCAAADEGCTELLAGAAGGQGANVTKAHLKVAPAYLRCYDFLGDGQPNTANDADTCGAFARGCTAADVGCERYTSADKSGFVNGQIANIDRCPAACVGYSAFREVESNFDRRGQFDFFIPSTARQCDASVVGCSEFTNLDALERGGESRESFTFLRQCVKPAEASSATYYTWEGSDQQGYQLRSFVLERSAAGDENSAPKVFGYVVGENANCGPSTQGGTGHYGKRIGEDGYDREITPDCRAFYSQNGDVNYRQLSRTILVTDECVRYRLSHSLDALTCKDKGGTFSATAGCILKGYRPESLSCSAESVGCRSYRGNSGGVVRTLVASDFEVAQGGDARQGWSSGTLSSESVNVGGHSLQVAALSAFPLREVRADITTEAACTAAGGVLGTTGAGGAWEAKASGTCAIPLIGEGGGTFELTIVGKGTGNVDANISADYSFSSSRSASERAVTFGTSWQRFTLGPALVGDLTSIGVLGRVNLPLALNVRNGTTFFDSILLREVPQATTVIKGSWVTPVTCDRVSIAGDARPQPQGMLGCRAYTTRANATEYLRSFSRMCGEGVVGCTAFTDTRNSTGIAEQIFNNPTPDPSDLDDVTIPADAPRYLVDDRAKSCAATAKGCRRFGSPTLNVAADRSGSAAVAGGWSDAFLLDQPDRYTGPGATLCTNDALSCEEYRGNDGTLFHFKDPGNRTCEFKEDVRIGGISFRGWFRVGTEATPCDASYLVGGATYGIWRNADQKYDGWVGTCELTQDQCAAFVDPTDVTAANSSGKPYYARRDTVDFSSCQGSVSQKEGCVVLEDQSDPSVRWSAEASAAKSDVEQGVRVPAVDCDRNPGACTRCVVERICRAGDGTPQTASGTQLVPCTSDAQCQVTAGFRCRGGEVGGTCATVSLANAVSDTQCAAFNNRAVCRKFANNGNAIVKVRRDRACAQKVTPNNCYDAWVADENRVVKNCTGLRHVGGSDGPWSAPVNTATMASYQQRDRSWSAVEPSGFSTPRQASLETLEQVRTDVGYRLSFVYCPVGDNTNVCGDLAGSCSTGAANGSSCGPAIAAFGNARGLCYSGRCAYGIGPPKSSSASERVSEWPAPVCKAFPERDAPFPPTVIKNAASQARATGFTSVNVCEGDKECGCGYKKVKYGDSLTKYFPADSSDVPTGYCVGGVHDGKECNPDDTGVRGNDVSPYTCNKVAAADLVANPDQASENGTCNRQKRVQVFRGIEGYCLERDATTHVNGGENAFACASFLPIDQIAGSVDVNSQVPAAGYQPPSPGGTYYCVAAKGNALPLAVRNIQVPYPSEMSESQYVIALRAESQYTGIDDSSINEENKALFTNARGGRFAFENHRFIARYIKFNDTSFADGDSFVDRTDTDSGERKFLDARNFEIHRSEIEKIVIRKATDLDGGGSWPIFDEEGPDMTVVLSNQNDWIACKDGSGPIKEGIAGTANSRCWGGRAKEGTESARDWVTSTNKFKDGDGNCKGSANATKYAGVLAYFTNYGYLEGMLTGYCHATTADDTFSGVDIFLVLREMCVGVVQAAGSASDGGYSKPWTNRLWSNNPARNAYTVTDTGYKYDKHFPPFGSASPTSAPSSSTNPNWWYIKDEGISGNPPTPSVDSWTDAGSPFACAGNCGGASFSGVAPLDSKTAITAGIERLKDVFAGIVNAWEWKKNGYTAVTGSELNHETPVSFDSSLRFADVGAPPVVRPVGVCNPSTEQCEESTREGVTVNGRSSGDVVGTGGLFPVDMKFFYEADTNRMPVRRIRVEWGDNKGSYETGTPETNSFPNRRGSVRDQATGALTPICSATATTFGESTDACVGKPFSMSYEYTCAGRNSMAGDCTGPNQTPGNAAQKKGGCWDPTFARPGGGTGACVFVPRVHVKDNWGFCNGRCPNVQSYRDRADGERCFDGTELAGANNVDECDASPYPASSGAGANLNPWTYFQGRVIVGPP